VRGSREWKFPPRPVRDLYPGKRCIIGNGVVVDPKVLIDELDSLRNQAWTPAGSGVGQQPPDHAYHLLLDQAGETRLGTQQIGTTRRGIGPATPTRRRAWGSACRTCSTRRSAQEDRRRARAKRLALRPFARDPSLDLHAMTEQYVTYGHQLETQIADCARLVWDALEADRIVLFEGAQGAMLDIDHGTYPFVTSSNPIAGAACVGAGVGPRDIDEIWGVCKAYTTRVGAGPFPTELDEELGEEIRRAGGEYGTTTGRARRTGWLDLVALRYAARLNTLSALAITKLDVLSGFERILVATRYRGQEGATFDHFPYHQTVLHHAVGDYTELEGWARTSASAARSPICPRPRATISRSSPTSSACGDADRRRARARADDLDRRRRPDARRSGCRVVSSAATIRVPGVAVPVERRARRGRRSRERGDRRVGVE